MGVKPSLDVMNDRTTEGQILTKLYNYVVTAPGGHFGCIGASRVRIRPTFGHSLTGIRLKIMRSLPKRKDQALQLQPGYILTGS
jgi:hypothetical protein